MKTIFLFLLIATIFSTNQNPKLEGTTWASDGQQHLSGDRLTFTSNEDVIFFLGELEWEFDSKYELNSDTLVIKTITAAFEVDDVTGMEADLIQKYTVTSDSLILIFLANRRPTGWIEATPDRYKQINNYYRIE